MATTRLALYNGALTNIGVRTIANLNVAEDSRRILDTVWNDGAVQFCLEQGQWKFAMRTQQLDYETSFTAQFGYQRAFTKGTDWVATSAVCSDEYYLSPILRYQDEIGVIYCDLDRIYVRYVSNDAAYGLDLSRWPASFTEYVKWYLASKIAFKATGSAELAAGIIKTPGGPLDKAKAVAQNNDARSDPPRFPPAGNWVRARQQGARSQWRDGGSRHTLIG